MRRRRQQVSRLLRAAGAALATFGFSGWTLAQEGPVVVGRQVQKPPTLDFYNTKAYLELLYRHESDSLKSKDGGSDSEFAEDRLEETFTLETQGHIVHPNLVDLNVSGTFGLVQESVDSSNTTTSGGSSNSTIYEWDISALILRNEDTPVTLYSRQTRQTLEQDFAPSIGSTLTTTGASLDYRSKIVPMRLEAYHQEQTLESGDGSVNTKIAEDVVTFHGQATPSKNQTLTWDYSFNSGSSDSTSPDLGTFTTTQDIHQLNASHVLNFGAKAQHNLTSSFNYISQTGDINLDQMHWNEVLRLKHTDNFDTYYQLSMNQQSLNTSGDGAASGESSDQSSNSAMAGFTHRLYQSLTTSGSIGYQQSEFSEGGQTNQFVNLGLDYRKKVPLGTFLAGLSLNHNQQENDALGQTIRVLDERFVFPAFSQEQRIVIRAPNIDPNSIRITDRTGLIQYQRDLHYTVTSVPGAIEIDRLIGAPNGIQSNQMVLVDYDLMPQAASTVTTNGFLIHGRYNIERGFFKGLSLYGRYGQQDQTVDSVQSFIPASYTNVLAGAEYRIGDLVLGAEQELYDSTILPFDATRFFARYIRRVSYETALGLHGTYQIIDYTQEPTSHIELMTFSATAQHRFSRNVFGSATVLWRDESNDLGGKLTGLEERLELRWRHRQVQAFIQLRNSDLDSESTSSSFQTIYIGVRRDF